MDFFFKKKENKVSSSVISHGCLKQSRIFLSRTLIQESSTFPEKACEMICVTPLQRCHQR